MHVSLVICLALFVVMVNCAAPQTSKARRPQSAYAYLRTVRGKNSCASGTCAFWERHGRSFAALRCYSQQYKECVCLHRMCFSSCMFSREECNNEMVQCLKQICPRCMPASSSSMCQVYDSMAHRVADALSVFACYPCCPNLANSPMNTSNTSNGGSTTSRPSNAVGNGTPGGVNAGGNGLSTPINSVAGARPNNVGTGPNAVNGARPNNNNGNTANFGGVFPGSAMTGSNGNMRNNSSSNNQANANANANVRPNQNQQIRQVTRPVTTRRPATTTRRVSPTTTARGNNIKNNVRKPAQAQKKPQLNN